MAVDVPEMVTTFMESFDDLEMVRRCDIFESSHEEVVTLRLG
jgi:hypothetical protein